MITPAFGKDMSVPTQSSFQKLNFGCGNRFSADWVNIDFHSESKFVQRVNLLNAFPFPDNHFDVVYSSHVLEHFDQNQGLFLISESFRVLKPGGIIRIVVPDLEGSCREYLRILSMDESAPDKQKLYTWIVIELLDQLVRSHRSGLMGAFKQQITEARDADFISYVISRTQSEGSQVSDNPSLSQKIKRITPTKVYTKLIYLYLNAVSKLIPKNIRSMVFVETAIGERHRWMYDRYGLYLLFQKIGFAEIQSLSYNESAIPNFNLYQLDCGPSGEAYKHNSIYFEGKK